MYFYFNRNLDHLIDEISRPYYLVKLNFFIDNYDSDLKILSLTIIYKLLKSNIAFNNYKKIGGLQFLIETLKKTDNSKIRVLTLNSIKGFTKNYEELPSFKKTTPLECCLNILK